MVTNIVAARNFHLAPLRRDLIERRLRLSTARFELRHVLSIIEPMMSKHTVEDRPVPPSRLGLVCLSQFRQHRLGPQADPMPDPRNLAHDSTGGLHNKRPSSPPTQAVVR
jgi:hypothetical protein